MEKPQQKNRWVRLIRWFGEHRMQPVAILLLLAGGFCFALSHGAD
jgi:hypothetical protein